jgi:hypothetical protein
LTPDKAFDEGAGTGSEWSAYSSGTTYSIDNDTADDAVAGFAYNKIGTDVLNITNSTMGVKSKSLTVTVADATNSINAITITAPDYMLTNSASVISMSATDQNGKAISISNLILTIDDPNKVTLTGDDNSNLTHGDSITDDDAKDLKDNTVGTYALKLKTANTTGTVTIGIRNAAGTVTATKTINIVATQNDMPAPVASVEFYEGDTSLVVNGTSEVKVKVINENGVAVANKQVTISSDQKAKAIGKSGINIRLASMLTSYEIELEEAEASLPKVDENGKIEVKEGEHLLSSLFKD